MALRRIPIHRSLHRPSLLLGAERELALMTGLVAFCCVFVAMSVPAAVTGFGLWFVVIALLRQMAKADPQLSHIYVRHIRYLGHYPARSTPWR